MFFDDEKINNYKENMETIFLLINKLEALTKKVEKKEISQDTAGRFLALNDELFQFLNDVRSDLGFKSKAFEIDIKKAEKSGDYVSFYDEVTHEIIYEFNELYHLLDVWINNNDLPEDNSFRPK